MREVHCWQHQYLGTKVLLSHSRPQELEAFFTFTAADIEKIQSRYSSAVLLIGWLFSTANLLADSGNSAV